MAKGDLDSLDVEVGQRVRALRFQKELSQQKLAKQLGVTFQQVQKYESGTSRIGIERLLAVADILGVPIYDFFTLPGQRAAGDDGDDGDAARSPFVIAGIDTATKLRS